MNYVRIQKEKSTAYLEKMSLKIEKKMREKKKWADIANMVTNVYLVIRIHFK